MGMKQILLMVVVLVLVGCGDGRKEQAAIVERAIRHEFSLNKPEGELTEADLARVTFISVSFKQITDVGLKELVKLQNLEMLFLYDAQITDAGLKELAKLQKLKILELNRTKITDAGLKEVAKLKQLTLLYLSGTKITAEGIAELRKALPNCLISGP